MGLTDPEPPHSRSTQRAEAWIAHNLDIVAGALATALLAMSSLVPKTTQLGESDKWYTTLPGGWLLMGLGVACFVAAALQASKNRTSNAALAERLRVSESDRAALQSGIDEWQVATQVIMERLCEAFCIALRGGTSERVSIYRHAGDSFVRLSRFSQNPRFRTGGRLKYPIGEGVMGRAWDHVSASQFVPPDRCGSKRQWANAMSAASGIAKAELMAMEMQSKSLLAMRIDDPGTRAPCAVLVFESTMSRADLGRRVAGQGGVGTDISHEFLAIFERDLGVALSEAVSIMSRLQFRADPDVARKEGF